MPKAATLFSTKLATSLLQSIKNCQGSDQCKKSKNTNQSHLSERELAGLQYLGGYIFRNLYRKVRSSKEWQSSQSQQSISLLLAAKVEKVEEANKLISCLDRGGLSAICTPAQNVLLRSQTYFKCETETNKSVRCIDQAKVVSKCLQDVDLVSNFQSIIDSSEVKIDNNVSKDLLHAIVDLFVRIRAYSYAKDIVQKYKAKQKASRAKGLRKEIKPCSDRTAFEV